MPNKNIRVEYSLLNCGAIVLLELQEKDTISSLWDKAKTKEPLVSYEKFLLTLDYLFLVNAIELQDGLIARYKND